jgi:hypothetical protein
MFLGRNPAFKYLKSWMPDKLVLEFFPDKPIRGQAYRGKHSGMTKRFAITSMVYFHAESNDY